MKLVDTLMRAARSPAGQQLLRAAADHAGKGKAKGYGGHKAKGYKKDYRDDGVSFGRFDARGGRAPRGGGFLGQVLGLLTRR